MGKTIIDISGLENIIVSMVLVQILKSNVQRPRNTMLKNKVQYDLTIYGIVDQIDYQALR